MSGIGLALANLDATPSGKMSENTNILSKRRSTSAATVAPIKRAMFTLNLIVGLTIEISGSRRG
jgi:hypothetical protein